MVSLKRSLNVKDIFSMDTLFYVKVTVEPYKSSGPAQCFICQRFGHSSLQCGHATRCVKCGGDHQSRTCTKNHDTKPTCCNCRGVHTANYRGCPSYTEILKQKATQVRITTKNTTSTPLETNVSQTSCNQPIQNKSYSDVTKNQPKPSISAGKITSIIQQLLQALTHCNDFDAKQSIIKTIMSII